MSQVMMLLLLHDIYFWVLVHICLQLPAHFISSFVCMKSTMEAMLVWFLDTLLFSSETVILDIGGFAMLSIISISCPNMIICCAIKAVYFLSDALVMIAKISLIAIA